MKGRRVFYGLDIRTSYGAEMTCEIDFEKVNRAIVWARQRHAGQTLKSGEDYFENHVIQVYTHVLDNVTVFKNKDATDVVIAALLHDVLEDTPTTWQEIACEFGDYVTALVERVTDEPGPNRKERKLTSYWKIRGDQNALVIKLCDRIVNVNLCIGSNREFGKMYLKEAYVFKCALFSPEHGNHISSLWGHLEDQYNLLEHIIKTSSK